MKHTLQENLQKDKKQDKLFTGILGLKVYLMFLNDFNLDMRIQFHNVTWYT